MLCFDGTRDGDLYLQLASGRFIAAHGFTEVDPFRTIAHGTPWLNQQWLSELLVYQVARWIGVTGLTVAYSALLAAPLGLLLWLCRRKGTAMMIALTALYCPGLWVVVHPRAAGFTVLGFSLLVVIVALAWLGHRSQPHASARLRRAIPAVILGFALWANLHAGFVAGLALIALATGGLVLDHRWGVPAPGDRRRIGLLALTGALAAGTTLVATPLGGAVLPYLMSFKNPAISLASTEWQPALRFHLAVAYIGAAGVFAAWLWWRAGSSRAWAPAVVTFAFLGLSLLSLRNIIFVGPVVGLMIASSAPDRQSKIPRALIALLLVASAGAAATWAGVIGPARNEPILSSSLVGYAVRHPPPHGHIAAYAGIGSYMLWRSPTTPVELDGWLEHFSASELRGTYSVLDGRTPNPMRYVRRLKIGAVIADRHVAIQSLLAHGFSLEFRNRAGAYLVRRSRGPRARPR